MVCGGNCKCGGNCRCGKAAEYDFSQKSAESFSAEASCNHDWFMIYSGVNTTPRGREINTYYCSFCKQYRDSSREPHSRGVCCKGNCSCRKSAEYDFSQKSAESFAAEDGWEILTCPSCIAPLGASSYNTHENTNIHCMKCMEQFDELKSIPLYYNGKKMRAEHNQTRFYRNLGVGAALVAGLAYWFKR
jgi:hypothetical protein